MENEKEAEWIIDEEDGDTHCLIASPIRVQPMPDGTYVVNLTTYETRQSIYAHNLAKREFVKWLKDKQKNLCSICGKELPKNNREIRLHHDPEMSKGGRYINYHKQMNFLVHRECHNQARRKDFTGHLRKDF